MTKKFVLQFKRCNGCDACNRSPQYKLCTACRTKASMWWNSRAKRKYCAGICVNCSRRRLKDGQRCSKCKEKNRVRCLEYMRTHREAITARFRAKGLCRYCGIRTPTQGFASCQTCLRRRRRAYRGEATKKPYVFQTFEAKGA